MMLLDPIPHTDKPNGETPQPIAPGSFVIEPEEIFGVIGFGGPGTEILRRLVERIGEHGRTVARRRRLVPHAGAGPSAMRSVGVLPQHSDLLRHRSALGNVCFPLEVAGLSAPDVHSRARACLEWIGLAEKSQAYPCELSAAEKRLVTFARALAFGPQVLLCDEPTANLEPCSANRILSILQAVNREIGVTILLATRSLEVVRRICHAVAVIEAGFVAEQLRLADLYAAPRTQLGRLLFTPRPRMQGGAATYQRAHLCLAQR
ncbi:MAG TPA: ATP-binding cassette domain-containing protein [Burkholderiales bacterium]|nr:ATP-binding cassette domain-containing protein [Burkholderiales bacterium]